MGTWALETGPASHSSDRSKLRDFFIHAYERGETVSVGDWERYLLDRRWERDEILEVVELPEDVAKVARYFGG